MRSRFFHAAVQRISRDFSPQFCLWHFHRNWLLRRREYAGGDGFVSSVVPARSDGKAFEFVRLHCCHADLARLFATPSTVRSAVTRKVLASSSKWDIALDEARNPVPEVSLLDSMDQTVERLLYHRGAHSSAAVSNRR